MPEENAIALVPDQFKVMDTDIVPLFPIVVVDPKFKVDAVEEFMVVGVGTDEECSKFESVERTAAPLRT